MVAPERHSDSWLKPCLPGHGVASLLCTAFDLKYMGLWLCFSWFLNHRVQPFSLSCHITFSEKCLCTSA